MGASARRVASSRPGPARRETAGDAFRTAAAGFPYLALDVADLVGVLADGDETEVRFPIVEAGQIDLFFIFVEPFPPCFSGLLS